MRVVHLRNKVRTPIFRQILASLINHVGHGAQFLRTERAIHLYRCRLRPGDAQVPDPYVLVRDPNVDENGSLTYSCQTTNFHIVSSVIYIDSSDASPGTGAPRARTTAKQGRATIHSEPTVLPEHDKTRQEWLRKVGELIAAVMFGKLPKTSTYPFVSILLRELINQRAIDRSN